MPKLVFLKFAALCLLTHTAHAQFSTEQYDQANNLFKKYFSITADGKVVKEFNLPSSEKSYVTTNFNDSKSLDVEYRRGEKVWSVKSQDCTQNKSFTCLSIYNGAVTRDSGNKQNPFANFDQTGSYTLYRINKSKPETSTVVSCSDVSVKDGSLYNSSNLSSCSEYSRASCDQLVEEFKNDPGLYQDIYTKGQECTNLLQKADKLKIKLSNIFQSSLKESEKEIKNNFDYAAGSLKVSVNTDKGSSSPVVLNDATKLYSSIKDRAENCKKLYSMFASKQEIYQEKLANMKQIMDSGPAKIIDESKSSPVRSSKKAKRAQ